jgi:hypothetical protein
MGNELEEAGLSKASGHIMYASARGYRVLRDGRVKSFTGRILKLRARFKGKGRRALDDPYLEFCAANEEGQARGVLVHRLQAYQKFGLEMFVSGLVVRHKNNITTDNAWSNIILGTYSENIMDKPAEVRRAQAQAAAIAKRRLTMEDARDIRLAKAQGAKATELCCEYQIGLSSIYAIVNNQSYRED